MHGLAALFAKHTENAVPPSLLSDVALDEVHFWRVVPSVRRVEFISPNLPEDSAVCFEEVELRRREQLRCACIRGAMAARASREGE